MYFRYFFYHLSTGVWDNFELGLFHWDHIVWLIMAATALPLLLWLCRNMSREAMWRMFKIMAVCLLITEVIKIIIPLWQTGYFDFAEDLPLWLSSMFVYLMPFLAWGKGRVRKVAIYSIVCIYFFSGILTMVMPLILYYYRVFTFFGLHSLVYHWLMIFVALLLYMHGHAKFEFKKLWVILIPFLTMTTIAGIANIIWGGDYMFLRDGEFTPFAMFNFLPHPIYISVVITAHLIMFFLTACLFIFLDRRRERKRAGRTPEQG